MAVGAGIAAAGIIGGMISSESASRRSAEAMARATAESKRQFDSMMEQYDKSVDELKGVGIPSMEVQRIALKAVELGPSALSELSANPEASYQQFKSLAEMDEISQPGLTPADRAEQFMISRGASSEAAAREKSIIQNMQERGVGGSGMELAARLSGSQAAADRAAMQQAALVSNRQKARMQAIQSKSQMAGQLRGQEYGEAQSRAQAKDVTERFNKQQRAAVANEMERQRAALYQQDYANRMSKAKAIASARSGTAQAAGTMGQQAQARGQAEAAGHLRTGEARSRLFGDLAGAGVKFASTFKSSPKVDVPSKPDYGKYDLSEYDPTKITAEDGGIIDEQQFEEGGLVNYFQDGGISNTEGGIYGDEGDFIDIGDEGLEEDIQSVPDSGIDEETRYLGGDTVPGKSYAGDRVDAKVNSGEMVLNLEQQQRLMELLKGLRDVQDLGEEDIVAPAPGTVDDLGELARYDGGTPAPTEMPPESLGMPSADLPPEEMGLPPVAPQGEELPFANGGMVPAQEGGDTDASSSMNARYPRGIHASIDHEKGELNHHDAEQKARKARIKALETLRDEGR